MRSKTFVHKFWEGWVGADMLGAKQDFCANILGAYKDLCSNLRIEARLLFKHFGCEGVQIFQM